MTLPEVNLLVEHAGHKLEVTGSGPEYRVRFPSLLSAIHFGTTLWPLRKYTPRGMVVVLEWRSLKFRYKS